VQWTEQTVFAGEEVECKITFKNVASNPPPLRTLLHPSSTNGLAGSERQRRAPIAQARNSNTLSPRPPAPARGHRSTLSMTAPVGIGRSPPGPGSWTGGHSKALALGSTHKRSVSIISIGASENNVDDAASNGTAEGQRMSRAHKRSASLQIIPRRNGINGPTSGLS
jgi:RAB6A-GEF complex partner protein 2